MARTVQSEAALGLRASVLVISSATAISSTVRGRPVRISSYSPLIPSAMKRLRHLPIVWGLTSSQVATTALLSSRSQASTIFARSAKAAGSERERVMATSCARSSLEIVSIAFGRPVLTGISFDLDTQHADNNAAYLWDSPPSCRVCFKLEYFKSKGSLPRRSDAIPKQ